MKFNTTLKLTKADVEKIILDHLRAQSVPEGATYKTVSFSVGQSSYDERDGWGSSSYVFTGATVNLDLEVK